jgi:MFS family permease
MTDQPRPPSGIKSRTFAGLLIAQFLSAFNDQALHAAAMFFAINTQTLNERDAISLMPILFYAPWAIFCTLAGWAADRFSKRSSLVVWKASELLFCSIALYGFWSGSHGSAVGPWLVLSTVFFMGMHAAFFGPAKYGCMPEILPPHELSQGNGLLESLSFMATIIGTVTGGVLSFLFLGREVWIGAVLLGMSVIGFLASLLIRPIPPAHPTRPFPPYLYGPIVGSLKVMWRSPALKIAIVGIAFFTFVVAFMRASVYMLGESQNPRWDELKTSAVVGTVALGIGFGAPIAGWLSGHTIRPRIILLGAFGMAMSCLAGAYFIAEIRWLVTSIVFIGFFTGFYLVPLFTLLQKSAPKEAKGEMVAISNFVDVSGAIAASVLFFALVLVAQKTGLAPEVTGRQSLGEGRLATLELHRGRPVFFEIVADDGIAIRGGTPAKSTVEGSGVSELWKRIVDSHGTHAILEVDKAVLAARAESPRVTVSKFEIDGVAHFDLVPAGGTPAADYDRRKLPRYLFMGAAGMVFVALVWLWRPVNRLQVS